MIKKLNLFDAFDRAMKSAPDGSRKEQFERFLETLRSNPAYLDLLATEYFDANAARWKMDQDKRTGSWQLVGVSAVQRRAEMSAERRTEITKVATNIANKVRAVILLDLTLPNGKKLRDSTGAECANAGGFYTEVSRHVKPTQVVDKHLNEADLRSIQSRYEGSKRRAAEVELRT